MSEYFCLSYFAGIGGFSLGAKALGIPTLGVEWIPELAELYRQNVGDCVIADISTLNPYSLNVPSPDDRRKTGTKLIYELSPPCQDHSLANTKKDPTSDRANLLLHCYQHTRVFDPEIIILENVKGYKKAQVYQEYVQFLELIGYQVADYILNAADFGVAQSRERLIMIATKSGEPVPVITPTHSRQQWIGWYEAIQDLIPDLPESKLTEAQERAIAHQLESSPEKAILVNSRNTRKHGYPARKDSEPCWTIAASDNFPSRMPKAFLVQRVGYYDGKPQTRLGSEPCWTLKAALADDGKGGRGRAKVIDCALDGGEVRSLDVKSLARLQSFPDSYRWSGNNLIDVKGIGNSVCPKFAKEILKCVL